MMNLKLLALGAASLAAAGAGVMSMKSAGAGNPLLGYVPADTPYLFATLEPLPEAARLRMQQYGKPLADAMKAGMREAMAESLSKATEGDSEAAEQTKAYEKKAFEAIMEIGSIFSDDAAAKAAGFTERFNIAVYGVGLVPVMRVELSDGAKAQATLERIMTSIVGADGKVNKPQAKMTREKLRSGVVLSFAPLKSSSEEETTALPVAIIENNQLILTIAPLKNRSKYLELLAPAKAVGNTGVLLGKLNALKKMGYTGYGLGYIDTNLFATRAIGKRSVLEMAVFENESSPKREVLSEICKKEIASITANIPRVSMGTTTWSGTQMGVKYAFELTPKIAQEYQGITTAIPNYGKGEMGKFAMALDVMKSINVMRTQARRIVDAPYQCEQLKDWNEGAQKTIDGLSNPSIGMAAMVKGFGVAFEDMTLPDTQGNTKASNASFSAALFSDQPQMALGLAQMQMPGIAELGLKDDGSIKALPKDMLAPVLEMLSAPEGFISMTKTGVTVSAGKNAKANLQAAQKAAASPTGTFMELSYGGKLMEAMVKMQQDQLAGMAGDEKSAATLKEIQKLQSEMLKQIDRFDFIAKFTAAGVEVENNTYLK